MSLRVGHLCGRSSESVVKLECKRSVSGSFATVSPVRWEIERRSAGATVPGGWSTSLLNSAHLLRSEGLTALYHYQLAQRTTTLQKRTSGQHLNDTDPRFITNYHPYAFELSAMQLDMPNPLQSLVAQVLKVSAIYSMLSFEFALKLNRN